MTAFAIPAAWTRAAPAQPMPDVPRRLPNDFYPTPPEATRALLSVEEFDGDIWEPACGDGRIAKVLADHGHAVVSTDLHAYGHGVSGIDFLRERTPRAKHIVTNPPYGWGLADRFVRRALTLTQQTGGKVAMLLNMASLCHPRRTAEWQQTPPARIYAIDDIFCWPDHVPRPPMKFFTQRYVWVVWEQGHQGPSAFWWLSSAAFREPNSKPSFNQFTQRRFS
ncbi:MAG: hypothetical protein AB7J30_00425 [Hyphomicrobium sp.]|uniref:hypothetical protein n=1 Tax=Hyphomicrobium sp. TaxID=82 RepID=UPI003D1450C3